MRIRTAAAFFALIACAALAHAADGAASAKNYRDKNFDYFVSGDPAKPRAAHTQFGLALMGGGGKLDAAYRFIATHAGGGHIVILRAVSDDSYDPDDGNYGVSFSKEWGPVVSAETIVFHNRTASSDPRVIAALKNADGIFLAGGDQSNYIKYWKGTPVQEALNAHVAANRPIGGSSAGLAILGHYSYGALDGGSLESKVALANPFDAAVTLESDFLHYRHLDDVITDTHFSQRHRLGRLITFLARLNPPSAKAPANAGKIFGIGVDEKTALLIGADGVGRLAEGSAGSAWIVLPQKSPTVLAAGKPLSYPDIHLVQLGTAGSIDLKSRAVNGPTAETTISINAGKLAADSIAAKILTRDQPQPGED
ncbi:MAG: cyanophycinase [Rudaea sp.]|uniref:cyanophycinase n=1 Tax=unclassified Rudaea TaxID=2627037 RepID=UPI00148550ED|nr:MULTISPECIES: cyanophycinase [unclassified Rudaea]MBN8888392.1 cyanophycinase [Rudaea sp.]MBR0345840.1 cyanophycinase [Rudaea sp.]